MKKTESCIPQIMIAILFFLLVNTTVSNDNFRMNQVGFYPEDRKVAVVIEPSQNTFDIIRASDLEVVYSGTLSDEQSWNMSEETGRQAVFSDFNEPGEYMVRVMGSGSSHPFVISEEVLRDAATASMKSFYFQRCSYELLPEYAGQWARAAGHPDLNVTLHSSTGKSGTIDAPYG